MPVKNRTLYESMESNLGSQIDITNTKSRKSQHNSSWNVWPHVSYYLRVLKPRETVLLTLIGASTAIVASNASPDLWRLLVVTLVVALGSGGTNGLTNYLDRHVDARMNRTRGRVLPSRLIDPPQKALAWCALLVICSLAVSLYLHPYAFFAALIGVLFALIGRKTWVTHFMGSFSSCGPVLVGWFSMNPSVNWTIVLMAVVIVLWLPIHVWNLMIASRDDYIQAGVDIFPLNHGVLITARISVFLSVLLYLASLSLYILGGFGWIYLVAANVGGLSMIWATLQILQNRDKVSAYRVFKTSAYPYLGLIFVSLPLDDWIARVL